MLKFAKGHINLTPSDLKAIMHSKRANIYYLEHCRLLQKDGRVLYLTESKKENFYYNIPIANTTVILLGTGTSITQAAVRLLAQAGVLIGFCGGNSTPLYAGTSIEWFSPQSEYRPTEYLQGWLKFWFNDTKRLTIAKSFQHARLKFLMKIWEKDRDLKMEQIFIDDMQIQSALQLHSDQIDSVTNVGGLMQREATLAKQLYRYIAQVTGVEKFVRKHDANDLANGFLNHGNYLAYGLAATTLWVLGIPHGFAVMHGKTRRGALVFDVADLIKDAIILPWAFICAKENASEQEFRQQIMQKFTEHKALDFMFEQVKQQATREDFL